MTIFYFFLVTIAASVGSIYYFYPDLFEKAVSEVKGIAIVATPTPRIENMPNNVTPTIKMTIRMPASTPSTTLTVTVTKTPTINLIPSKPPTPSPTSILALLPTDSPSTTSGSITPTTNPNSPSNSGSMNADTLFNLVNAYRTSKGLTAFQKESSVCGVAQQRAPQVYSEIFGPNSMHSGLKALNLPYWITETMVYNTSEQDAVDWLVSETAHRQVIETNYKYSCAACSGNSCVQVYTSLVAK